jgi:hypothetical protein
MGVTDVYCQYTTYKVAVYRIVVVIFISLLYGVVASSTAMLKVTAVLELVLYRPVCASGRVMYCNVGKYTRLGP